MQIMKSYNQSTFITFQAEVEVKLRDETNLVRAIETGLRATFSIEELKGVALRAKRKEGHRLEQHQNLACLQSASSSEHVR